MSKHPGAQVSETSIEYCSELPAWVTGHRYQMRKWVLREEGGRDGEREEERERKIDVYVYNKWRDQRGLFSKICIQFSSW